MDAERAADPLASAAGEPQCPRIVIVSRVCFVREALAAALERDPSISRVGHCGDLGEAAALGSALPADAVLLDAAFRNDPAVLSQVRDLAREVPVIAYGVRETKERVIAWAEAGVIGYIPSTASLALLGSRVAGILEGEQVCRPAVAAALLRHLAATAHASGNREAPPPRAEITKREREVAELISAGLSDKEIARRLNIGLATTKSHVHNLLVKLNVRRRGRVAAGLRRHDPHPWFG